MTTTVQGSWGRSAAGPGRILDLADLRSMTRRRKLQIALATIWLVDAALQYQPYMFGRDFVTQTIEPAAAGTPYIVAHPSVWAAHLMLHHITLYNVAFASIQLLIAAAIFWGPTVREGLAVSVVWALAVWWLGEGIGGITVGASAVMGAPGAVLLYAVIALLVWPRHTTSRGTSVATSGALGAALPKILWSVMWIGFAVLGLENVNRSPSALAASINGLSDGEPGWIQSLNRGLATPLAHRGTEWSISLTVIFVAVAVGIWITPAVRTTLLLAVVVGAVFWLAQDFGGIFTGSGTDVNSGPLLILWAATLWPFGFRVDSGRGASARRAAGGRPGAAEG